MILPLTTPSSSVDKETLQAWRKALVQALKQDFRNAENRDSLIVSAEDLARWYWLADLLEALEQK